jgi:hypothetical protein
VRLGLTDVEKRSFARRSNALRRHLTRKQLRELVADQLRETPERANNWIANDLGVDGKTVASIRARLERTSEIPKLTKFVGADGKERGARTPSIMVPGLAELRDVLAKAETMPPDQAAGFIAAHNPSGRVYRVEINPFADRSEEAIREWHLFVLYLIRKCGWEGDGAIMHLEWLLDRFHAVSDALSAQFRRSCGLSPLPESTIIGWERFAAEHRDQPKDEIVRMVNAARSEVSQNNNSRRIQRRPRRTGAI